MKRIYTVLWKQSAEDQLAAIWLGADDRDAVTTKVVVLSVQYFGPRP